MGNETAHSGVKKKGENAKAPPPHRLKGMWRRTVQAARDGIVLDHRERRRSFTLSREEWGPEAIKTFPSLCLRTALDRGACMGESPPLLPHQENPKNS